MAATYGRKFKGASRRVPITVHAPLDRLDAIDEYVEERRQQEGKAYSRSDFYEEAAALNFEKQGRGQKKKKKKKQTKKKKKNKKKKKILKNKKKK